MPVSQFVDPRVRLSETMRRRLLAAVRALLRDPALSGSTNSARCGLIVASSKCSHASLSVPLSVRQLSRLIGVTMSTVDHDVLPALRGAGSLETEPLPLDAAGLQTGLRMRPTALRAARESGDPRHPLALSRPELSVLMGVVEAVLSPGYGPGNPPGVLAGRSGRDAATDRLALLVLLLLARPGGRVRLVSGPLPAGVDRAVATLARELVCPVPAAAAALARLQGWGQVEWTEATEHRRARLTVGLLEGGRGRPKVPDAPPAPQGERGVDPVKPAPTARCGCCSGGCEEEQLLLAGEGWVQESLDEVPEPVVVPAASAEGELGFEETAYSQSCVGHGASLDEPGGAEFHASHAGVVEVSSEGSGGVGFSGNAVEGDHRLRSGAHEREEPHADDETSRAASGPGPLRGEKRTSLPETFRSSPVRHGVRRAQGKAASYRGQGPVPAYVVSVLAPVWGLWERLDRPRARQLVEQAVAAELEAVRSVLGPCDAELVLAERLAARVDEQQGVPVRDPVGWLVGRGLPKRPGCWSATCDDGVDMAGGEACRACGARAEGRRAGRAQVAREVRALMPDAAPSEISAEVERRMREAWSQQARRVAAARGDAEERSVRLAAQAAERSAAAARAQAEARVRPCGGCGAADSNGWCVRCADRGAVQAAVDEVRRLAAASWLPGDAGLCERELAARAGRRVTEAVRAAVERAEQDGADPGMLSVVARLVAETEAAAARTAALTRLEFSGKAEEEARRAGWVESRRLQFASDRSGVDAAVEQAAASARARAAQALLQERLAELAAAQRAQLAGAAGDGDEPRGSWAQRLAQMGDRPLEAEVFAGAPA